MTGSTSPNSQPATPTRSTDLQPDRLREVFTTDAVWEMVGGIRLVGLDEIMAFMGRPDVHPGAHLMTNIYIESVSEDPRDGGPLVHLCSRGVYPGRGLGSAEPDQRVLRTVRRRRRADRRRLAHPTSAIPARLVAGGRRRRAPPPGRTTLGPHPNGSAR